MVKGRIIRVAFFGYENFGWTGGLNYLRNLLHALKMQEKHQVEVFLFVSRTADPLAIEPFKKNAKVITVPKMTPDELVKKVIDKLTGSKLHLNYILKKHKIDVISHSYLTGVSINVKKISWIPDFQHLHLPEMFSALENQQRDIRFKNKIDWADRVILSSNDALGDFNQFAPEDRSKAYVLQFVSNIEEEIYNLDTSLFSQVCTKYQIPERFFYLPNQFWNHKNHQVVFEAVRILKSQGISITICCTGNMEMPEVRENVTRLKEYIQENNLSENIYLLGLVAYKEVQTLLRYAVSVINPSLFEGWSSTVEECKSLGKNMVISDIPVHREQNPPETIFFNPADPEILAKILNQNWEKYLGKPDHHLETIAKAALPGRIKAFGENYAQLLFDITR